MLVDQGEFAYLALVGRASCYSSSLTDDYLSGDHLQIPIRSRDYFGRDTDLLENPSCHEGNRLEMDVILFG